MFIKDRIVCVKLLSNRIEAIQKLQPPTTVKRCRNFAGMINFLSMVCQELQKLLKPIYDLTRKGRQLSFHLRNSKELIHNKIRIGWFSYKYSQFFSFIKINRF